MLQVASIHAMPLIESEQMSQQKNFALQLCSLVLLAVLLLASPPSFADFVQSCAERPFDKGKLWEVRKDNGPKSFLFGTMHSKDPRILHLPGVVMQALNRSQVFIMETTLSRQNMQESRTLMMAPYGEDLREQLGENRLTQLKKISPEYRIPLQNLLQLKIWAIASVLSQPPTSPSKQDGQLTLLDRELEKVALNQNKQIVPLESAADQLGLFDNLSLPAQLELLDSALEGYQELDRELEQLTQHYLKGETGWFFCNMEDELKSASPEIKDFVLNKLIINRNKNMVDGIVKQIENAEAFIAIGALHLPGEKGVLNHLLRLGYTIRKRF